MSIRLLRKNSEIPTVENYDDARILRYATGGFNGVVKDFGNEFAYSVAGSIFSLQSGDYILQGWQSVIDGSGIDIAVDSISGTQYYVVYVEVNLSVSATQKTEIKAIYDTVAYPTVTAGDDLTTTVTGIARRELYRFEASSGVISNVVAQFDIIEVGKVLNAVNLDGTISSSTTGTTQDVGDNSQKVATTEFVTNKINSKQEVLFENLSGVTTVDLSAFTFTANEIIEVHFINDGTNRYSESIKRVKVCEEDDWGVAYIYEGTDNFVDVNTSTNILVVYQKDVYMDSSKIMRMGSGANPSMLYDLVANTFTENSTRHFKITKVIRIKD